MPDIVSQPMKQPADALRLQHYLYQNIPLSAALGVRVEQSLDKKIVLSAPLKLNINHKKTVFGGSLHAVATLACWSLVWVNLQSLSETAEIIITHSEIDYLKPVTSDFRVEASLADTSDWLKFHKLLAKKGRAKLLLSAQISQDDQLAVRYQGSFAALKT